MKKFLLFNLLFCFFLGFRAVVAGQISLFNKTGKRITLSIKFFHNKAQQKMVIKGFVLEPLEKTKFPQDKDVHLASPLKISVKRTGDRFSVTKTFARDDASVQNLEIIERGGHLKLVKGNHVRT